VHAPILAPGGRLAPLLRFQPYNAHYASMMAAIHIVWAVMLWRAAAYPAKHLLFIRTLVVAAERRGGWRTCRLTHRYGLKRVSVA